MANIIQLVSAANPEATKFLEVLRSAVDGNNPVKVTVDGYEYSIKLKKPLSNGDIHRAMQQVLKGGYKKQGAHQFPDNDGLYYFETRGLTAAVEADNGVNQVTKILTIYVS